MPSYAFKTGALVTDDESGIVVEIVAQTTFTRPNGSTVPTYTVRDGLGETMEDVTEYGLRLADAGCA